MNEQRSGLKTRASRTGSDYGLGLVATLMIATVSASCVSASSGLPPVAWRGKHVEFATTVGRLPCGDSLEFMDDRIGQIVAELDQPMGREERITYYWLPGRMDMSPCPPNADCAEGSTVYSRTMFHDHEVVHVLLRSLGRSHTFLYEGMAEALGRAGGRLTVERNDAKSEILNSLSANVDPAGISYPLAGLFSRFLIETQGMGAVKRVYAQARHDTDIDEMRKLFEDELGSTLDELVDRLVEEAPNCYPRTNLCAEDPVPWNDGLWRSSFGLSCHSQGVLEIFPGALRNDSVLEVSEPGSYLVTVSDPSNSIESIAIARCECQPEVLSVRVGSEAPAALESGLYRVIAGRSAGDLATDDGGPVEVTIRSLSANTH